LIGVVLSDILGLLCFSILAYFGPEFDMFGVNRGHLFTLNSLTHKMQIHAWFHAFWAIKRQNPSRRQISARASEKNIVERIHLFAPKFPVNGVLPNLACGDDSWT